MRANGLSRTQSSSKELVKEITALKAQLRKLSASMEADASDGVKGALSAIEVKSRAAIDEAIEAAQAFIDEQTDNVREITDAALDKTSKMRDAVADSLIETVQARPLATLAAVWSASVFCAGFATLSSAVSRRTCARRGRTPRPRSVSAMIGPLRALAAASAAGRALKDAASEASNRVLLTAAACAAGLAGLLCFSQAALTVMERHMDPAEAWSAIGGVYAVLGGILYFAATRRRR